MRKLITIILVLAASVAFSQTTYQLNYDSIRVGKTAGNGATSLYGKTYLKNATEGTPSDSVLTVRNGRVYKIAGSAISSVGFLTYVFSRTASDISGYEQMPALTSYTAGAADTATVSATTTPAIIQEFATNTGFPNTTLIPAGVFNVTYQTQKNSGSQSYYTYAVIYKRNLSGTETAIATTNNSSSVSANTVQTVTVSAVSPSDISVLTTDRIVVKVFAVMVSGTANISIYYDDATDSRLAFPSALVDATNFMPYNGAVKDLVSSFSITGDSIKRVGGTGAQFLMGNGTVQDTTAIQTVANFFPKGDTRYAKIGDIPTLGTSAISLGGTANGLSYSGGNYRLHKVTATTGGVLTTGTDTIGGQKRWNGFQYFSGNAYFEGTTGGILSAAATTGIAISGQASGNGYGGSFSAGGSSGYAINVSGSGYGLYSNTNSSLPSLYGRNVGAGNTLELANLAGSTVFSVSNTGALSGSSATFTGTISSTPQGTLYGTASGSITSAQLATSLTDETGTGNAVFSASPTFTGTITAAAAGFTGAVNLATSSGNVLIGTTTDAGYKLDVNGTGRFSGALSGTSATFNSPDALIASLNTTGSTGYFTVGTSGGAKLYVGTSESILGGTGFFDFNSSATNGLRLGAGSVALTISPTGAATFSSSVTATSFFESSDLRYKDILKRSSSSDFDMISYKWKPELNRDNKVHFGYVAQEVEKVYPDQVQTDEKGFKSVNYIEILVKKISDLEHRIKQLEK